MIQTSVISAYARKKMKSKDNSNLILLSRFYSVIYHVHGDLTLDKVLNGNTWQCLGYPVEAPASPYNRLFKVMVNLEHIKATIWGPSRYFSIPRPLHEEVKGVLTKALNQPMAPYVEENTLGSLKTPVCVSVSNFVHVK